ncbi:MAG: glycoside hydrolase family 13 protein [Bacteroidota bacterium]
MSRVLLLLAFVLGFTPLANAQLDIQHVEPPNWWVGMQSESLQLMLHAERIGHTIAKIDYPGVRLTSTTQVPNQNFLFLNLEISPDAQAGTLPIELWENDKKIQIVDYPLWERKAGSAERQGFNSTDVMYLITPDRFANGDPSNDTVDGLKEKVNRKDAGGRHGGDIAGIRQNLDYIHDMGFTALWLNPVLENDMNRSSYHGYSTTDYYQVDARFGSNEDYLKLSQEASQKGIKLIMDMIANHCGSEHWWMDDMPTDDWINIWPEGQNGFKATNHRRTTLQDPYAAPSDRKWFQDGWFVPSMPDLNQNNPLMATYLIQNSIWWVEFADLGGIRMDTYSYPERDFMGVWTERIMAEYPNFSIVGEEWFSKPSVVSYWQRGKETHNGFYSELTSLMDFPIQVQLTKALNTEESWGTGWIELYEMLSLDYLYPNPQDLVIFADNHDMSRVFTQLDEDYSKFQNAMAFLLTMRGTPQIFYGTEILMSHPGTDAHVEIRADFPGGWKGDKADAFTGEGLSAQAKECQEMMRKLLNWRKTQSVVHTGNLMHYGPLHDGIYVYFRYDQDQKLMVILNKNPKERNLDLSRFSDMLSGNETGKDVLSGDSYSLNGQLKLPAAKPLILEIE